MSASSIRRFFRSGRLTGASRRDAIAQIGEHIAQHGEALEQHARRIDELTRTAEALLKRLDGQERAHLDAQRDLALRLAHLSARMDDDVDS